MVTIASSFSISDLKFPTLSGDDADQAARAGAKPGATQPGPDSPLASGDPFDDFEDDDFDDEFDDDFEETWDDEEEDDGFGPEYQEDPEEDDGDKFSDDPDFDD